MGESDFDRVLVTRRRPGFTVSPASITWSATAFQLDGPRRAVLCVPRTSLATFLDALDDGRLDDEIRDFLAAAPSGRVLASADQARRTALFDELRGPDAIAPTERVTGGPARVGGFGGGSAADIRREKGRRRSPGGRRGLILGAVAAVVVAAIGATVVALDGDDDAKVTATGGAAAPTTAAGGLVDGKAPPPDPATLPPGAVLLAGDSGDTIGSIAQDGQFRYLSLVQPGVVKGDAAGRSIAVVWDKGAGHVISFGANFHTTEQPGRYGVNVFRNAAADGSATTTTADVYKHGCAVEIGQTACRADNVGSLIVDGDLISIQMGEAGNLDATGDFTIDWWFVFQPA